MVKLKPISFFIPAYNSERTITESILSIVNGNLEFGDEIIVVNDASSDNTLRLVEELSVSYPIRIISHAINKGGGAARNTAIIYSKYDILFCLDSDNILEKNSVVKLRIAMDEHNADAVAFDEIKFFTTNHTNVTHKWQFKKGSINFSDILSGNVNPASSGNYLFTKKSWEKAGKYPENAGALDAWGFGMRQTAKAERFITIPGYYFHRHGHTSYFRRYILKDKLQIDSLNLINPFFSMIYSDDLEYIKQKPDWISKLNERPIKTSEQTKGVNGSIVYYNNLYYLKKLAKKILRFYKK